MKKQIQYSNYILIGCLIAGMLLTSCQQKADYDVDDDQKTTEAQTDFSFALMHQLAEEEKSSNQFFSPISIHTALQLAYHGTNGATQTEMEQVLGTDQLQPTDTTRANAALMEKLKQQDSLQLTMANAIWLRDDFTLADDYQKNMETYYDAKVGQFNIQDPDAVDSINSWVNKATEGQIEEMVKSPIKENAVSFLLNAVYFQADWTFPFPKEATEEKPFHLENGNEKDVPMMALHEDLDYMKQDDFEAVRLPYGEEQEASMYLFLPDKETTLNDWLKQMDNETLQTAKAEVEKQEGTVYLPSFTLETETDLNTILQKMGMEKAFDKEDADFSNMLKEEAPLWISDIKHKAVLEVDEKGTEASGATSVEIETTSAPLEEPFEMNIDRPFFLLIEEEETDTILFMGAIYEPGT